MADIVSSFPGLYPLGSARNQTFVNGGSISSIILNTGDIYTPGETDFFIFGPGSQVWYVGYSIRASRPSPFPAPTDPLGLTLRVEGSYDSAVPFVFHIEQQIILPVYSFIHHFAGRARVESTQVALVLINLTGNDLEVSYQFWGKAL